MYRKSTPYFLSSRKCDNSLKLYDWDTMGSYLTREGPKETIGLNPKV
jgi:hypothetical protein